MSRFDVSQRRTCRLAGVMVEKEVGPSLTSWSEYLYAGGALIGEHVTRSDLTEDVRYFVSDHLGSIAVLTDATGAVAERLSYDAWGKRRYANGADDPTGTLTSQTSRGFTGHEMIDEVGLVNMNGRVYDPQIGRFMSADPVIPDVTNGQSLNRYSYVNNNPLSYTDPSGHFLKGLFKGIGKTFQKIGAYVSQNWRVFAAIAAATALMQPWALPGLLPNTIAGFETLSGAVASGISGGVASVIATGRPESFATGFAQGVATFGVGHGLFEGVNTSFGTPGYVGKAAAHGVVGGTFGKKLRRANAIMAKGGQQAVGIRAAGADALGTRLRMASLSGSRLSKTLMTGAPI